MNATDSLGAADEPPVDGGNDTATLHNPASQSPAAPPKQRTGISIPVALDDGWLAHIVIPSDISRAEMLRLRRVIWTLEAPWRTQ